MKENAERWAKERFPDELSVALILIGKVAFGEKRQTIISLTEISGNLAESLLADLVVAELKKMGFGVYCRESGKVKEYCVTWGKDRYLAKVPEGFKPVE